MNELEFLKSLEKDDITFILHIPSAGGYQSFQLSPNEIMEYKKDKTTFIAKCHDVTTRQYLKWENDEMMVRCSGLTTAGKQCKNVATGGNHVSPKKWVELQGSYCAKHGG